MNNEILFNRLFGIGNYNITIDGFFIHGNAVVGGKNVAVIGTCRGVAIDSELALKIADSVLRNIKKSKNKKLAPFPIIFLVDTEGHKLSRHEEFTGINGYFAHMAKCIDFASFSGHKTVSIIHGKAVSGCFLAFAMMADHVCALPNSEIYVMNLQAMSKITKIDYNTLKELSEKSPVFAPGAKNYWEMGGVHEIWKDEDDWLSCLSRALNNAEKTDNRYKLGFERGGRQKTEAIIKLMLEYSSPVL